MTFGFRGEALASIASVSKFSLVSSSGGKSYRLDCADGATKGPYEYPLDTGTRVEVGSLFYNTPARLNYLKTPRTEQAHIVQYLQQMALVYPGVSFECIADDKQVFYVKGTDEPIQRIYEVYGQEVSDSLLRVDVQLRGIGVSGYISDPKVSYANKQRQSLYINSRSVTSPIIFTAIQNAYNRFIPHGQFPVYILNIEVDPTQVDVNVHPRKKEVRFANESEIFRAVYHAIEDTLTNVSLIKRTSPAFSEASSGGVEGGSSQNTFSASIA
ncbi:MAG: hypothetical protein H6767_06200 [Candidatus Peribacteria bacterium]|nr:MAG: hypothetical protein H6767_06200 [Candidatus Peribacteria bacterium]